MITRDQPWWSFCSGGRILDVGTGPGWLLPKILNKSSALQPTGMDISPHMVARALKNMKTLGLSKSIDFIGGSASHIPFKDKAFDMVISTGSIHHWKNPVAGLNEVYRVLKPGGHALMYDLVSDTPISCGGRLSSLP